MIAIIKDKIEYDYEEEADGHDKGSNAHWDDNIDLPQNIEHKRAFSGKEGWIWLCEHINRHYQPREYDTNVAESYTCEDCGAELDIPEPDWDLINKEK